MFLSLFLAQLVLISGFLLDGQSNNEQSQSNQFITRSEFMKEKRLLRSETESLRRDMDNSFVMLTSQLKRALIEFESKIYIINSSVSTNLCVSLDDHQALIKKYEDLRNSTESLDIKFRVLMKNLETVQNKTSNVEKDVISIKNLETIKPAVEIKYLNKSITNNSIAVHELQANEQSRNQDFLALFRKVKDLEDYSSDFAVNQSKRITELENDTRVLEHQLQEYTEQVAFTSYPPVGIAVKGNTGPIPFTQVSFSIGINDLSSLIQNGTFTCEKPGLYLISVTVATNVTYPEICTFHNGHHIACTEIGMHEGGNWHSGSAIIVRTLKKSDEIWAQAYNSRLSTFEGGIWSQFTIIKVK